MHVVAIGLGDWESFLLIPVRQAHHETTTGGDFEFRPNTQVDFVLMDPLRHRGACRSSFGLD